MTAPLPVCEVYTIDFGFSDFAQGACIY